MNKLNYNLTIEEREDIIKLQLEMGITPDGIAGIRTLNALEDYQAKKILERNNKIDDILNG